MYRVENDQSIVSSPALKKYKSSPKQDGDKNEELVKSVCEMKVKELQTALRARNLNAMGRKQELRQRLLMVLQNEHFSGCKNAKQLDLHYGVSDPVNFDANRNCARIELSDEPRHSIVMIDLVEETGSMRISDEPSHTKRLEDAMCVDLAAESPSEDDPAVFPRRKSDDVEMQDDACENNEAFQETIPSPPLVIQDPSRRSRSPLKRVQDGVNSAMKMITSKISPNTTCTENSPVGPAVVNFASASSATGKMFCERSNESKPGAETSEKVIRSENSGIRIVDAPSTAGSASLEPSSMQKGSAAIKSQKFQAKNEARMAKLKEMREKVSNCIWMQTLANVVLLFPSTDTSFFLLLFDRASR
jgi:hypothetical protein